MRWREAIHWLPMREAQAFVARHHRHRRKVQGGIIAIGLWVDDQLRGVAIIGRGARLNKPDIAVITRLCTDGCRNGCSRLYSKAKRLAQALGFTGSKTYTRQDESGASLFACGAEPIGLTDGGHWSRECRPRDDSDTSRKVRWKL